MEKNRLRERWKRFFPAASLFMMTLMNVSVQSIEIGLYADRFDEEHTQEWGHGCASMLCYPKNGNCWCGPRLEIHGMIRADVVALDRVPLYGNNLQPYGLQVPLDKEREHKHGITYLGADYSSIAVEVRQDVCDTKLYGVIVVDLEPNNLREFQSEFFDNSVNQVFLRAEFPSRWYVEAGHMYDLITVTNIANPLALPICEVQGPAGMTYARRPTIRVGGYTPLGDCYGEIHYFAGIEQQALWTGIFRNPQIALFPALGEPFKYPLFGLGVSYENWEPLQLDLRAAVSQNRFAIAGSRDLTERLSWMGKASIQSRIWNPTFYASYSYMDGMSRYMLLSFPDAVFTEDEKIDNVKSHGLFAGTWFDICGCVNCNLMFGWAWAKSIDCTAFEDDVYNQYRSAQVCFWKEFCDSYAVSVEYKRWKVRSIDADKGNMNQFMGTISYYF